MRVVCIDTSGGFFGDEELYYKVLINRRMQFKENYIKNLKKDVIYTAEHVRYNNGVGYFINIEGGGKLYYNCYRFRDLIDIRQNKLEKLFKQ